MDVTKFQSGYAVKKERTVDQMSLRVNNFTPFWCCTQSHKYSESLGAISTMEATPGGVFVSLMSRYLDVLYPVLPPRSMLPQPLSSNQSGIYVTVSPAFPLYFHIKKYY